MLRFRFGTKPLWGPPPYMRPRHARADVAGALLPIVVRRALDAARTLEPAPPRQPARRGCITRSRAIHAGPIGPKQPGDHEQHAQHLRSQAHQSNSFPAKAASTTHTTTVRTIPAQTRAIATRPRSIFLQFAQSRAGQAEVESGALRGPRGLAHRSPTAYHSRDGHWVGPLRSSWRVDVSETTRDETGSQARTTTPTARCRAHAGPSRPSSHPRR